MSTNLTRWASALAAIDRTPVFERCVAAMSHFERIKFANLVLGPDWIFRLHELVGDRLISENRPTWMNFYVNDIYQLNLPLNPAVPETRIYLPEKYARREIAFYAGMGFDGYLLALNTKREVDIDSGRVYINTYEICHRELSDLAAEIGKEPIAKEFYYRIYADTLDSMFAAFESKSKENGDVQGLLNVAAANLVFLCGGHNGCKQHLTPTEQFISQKQAIITFAAAKLLYEGKANLNDASIPEVIAA